MRYERRALLTLLALLTVLVIAPGGAARATETQPVGEAQARVATPQLAGYSLVVPMGVAQADVDGTGARASSAFIDWTVPATLARAVSFPTLTKAGVPAEAPDFPGPARADSNGKQDVERPATLPYMGPTGGGAGSGSDSGRTALGYEQAHTTDAPAGWSQTDVGALVLGPVAMAGGSSRASMTAAEGVAGSALGELRIGESGAEAVVLRGLEWRAVQSMGQPGTASFSVGSAVIDGTPQSAGTAEELAEVVVAANEALAPTGLSLALPEIDTAGTDGAAVGPLVIRYSKSQVAGMTIDPAYAALAPVLFPAVAALQEQIPEVGTAFYVSQVILASLAGHGDARLELGGASAWLERRPVPKLSAGVAPPPAPVAAPPRVLGEVVEVAPVAPSPAGRATTAAAAPEAPGFPQPRSVPVVEAVERLPGWLVSGTTLAGLVGIALVTATELMRRRKAAV